jgi:protein arginine phosphatase
MINILFVCTGNTCRSPMAEAILKSHNIEGVSVKSAGVFAMEGSDASLNAKLVLQENNIEHVHSSKMLTIKEVEWATYILTMTESHKNMILSQFEEAEGKTFTLKEFVEQDEDDLDVVDPFGGDIDVYRQTFQELQTLIEQVVQKLKKE